MQVSDGKMKFSSESIPASSEVFWNRFRIVGPESVSGIESGIGSGIGSRICSGIGISSKIDSGISFGIEIGSVIGSGLVPKSESESIAKRSRFLHLHKNRRLAPMMLRIESRKESKFICKQSFFMEISGLILLL